MHKKGMDPVRRVWESARTLAALNKMIVGTAAELDFEDLRSIDHAMKGGSVIASKLSGCLAVPEEGKIALKSSNTAESH